MPARDGEGPGSLLLLGQELGGIQERHTFLLLGQELGGIQGRLGQAPPGAPRDDADSLIAVHSLVLVLGPADELEDRGGAGGPCF